MEMNNFLSAGNTNTGEGIFAYLFRKSILIVLVALLLIIFSVASIIANKSAQDKIQQIENVDVAVPFQLSLLFNEVNLASAAQNNYFKTGDTVYDVLRKNIWLHKIKPIADTLTQMKNPLPAEDKLLIEKAISGLEDYEIAQQEMNLIWMEAHQNTDVQQKSRAENLLNEKRLILTGLTQDDIAAILIPLQNKYQAKAKDAMQIISNNTKKSNIITLVFIFFTLSLILLLLSRQKDLVKAKKQAIIASKAKSEFLANMSHEIRTPLNGVIGFTDLLMQSKLNEIQFQYMGTVSQSANALLDIINDILDFSKIEAGKLELSIEKVDLIEICNQVADMVKYQAHKKELELLLNVSAKIPRYIWTDEVRLRQILVNLLSNAVKFTEFGEIELKIETLPSTNNNDTVFRFGVRDTGIGVDPKNQKKIFEAFSQEDGSTTKRFGGTGLGLTITNKLLSMMGSQLQLQSETGKGSTFYFDVTFKTMFGQHFEWDNEDDIKNILIVDDNTNNRVILREMLALKSIASEEAKSGKEALEKLKQANLYDVILMDYHMPFMDGIDTIRNIRELYPLAEEQPIILLYSSSDDAYIIEACDKLKVKQRLVKPLKIQQLYNALSYVKRQKKKTDVPEIQQVNIEKNTNSKEVVKVLIAEDNVVNMLLAKTIIKNILPGITILEATTGRQALDLFVEQLPAIIFMDIQMPELNGYDATAAIRKTTGGSNVPIIALTAGTVLGEKEKCAAAGMNDYISKPFVKATIEAVLNKWLPVK